MRRLFDHIDLRVRSSSEAESFYTKMLPAVGFSEITKTTGGIGFKAKEEQRTPVFVWLIEDAQHQPNATRIAFWAESKADLDRIAPIIVAAGAHNIEGPMFCLEYSPSYYAMFFEDPGGNRFEICCRDARN